MVKKKLKDKEMAQWLKSVAYLKEVHDSIPSSHIGPTSKGSDVLLTSLDTKHAQATQTHIQATRGKIAQRLRVKPNTTGLKEVKKKQRKERKIKTIK